MPIAWILVALCISYAQGDRHIDHSSKLHFVLIHGAGHGAWCWFKIIHKLEKLGHKVDALDLTSSGTSAVHANTVQTLGYYSAPLIKLLESVPEDSKVILVGHSLGGVSVTYAIEKFPERISSAVFVTGLMLSSNETRARSLCNKIVQGFGEKVAFFVRNGSTVGSFKPEIVKELLYQRSPPQDFVLAKMMLRPFPLFDPAVSFTNENYGRVPRYYIKAKKDNTIPINLQEKMIIETPPLKVMELNSDHSPFFSMPQTLVDSILKLVSSNEQ